MGNLYTEFHIQSLIGLLFLAFCLIVAVVGFLLLRFRFLDGKGFDFSRTLGLVLLIASLILTFAAVLMLFYVRMTL